MGTAANSADEWVELYNSSASAIDLTGWGLYEAGGGTLILNLSGTIAANGYYLIERTDDNSVSDITADVFGPFAGSGLNNNGEHIVLKDSLGATVDSMDASAGWPAGDNAAKASMERKSDGAWQTNDGITINGKNAQGGSINGTPKAANSSTSSGQAAPAPAPERGSGAAYTPVGTSTPVISLKAEAGSGIVAEIGQTIKFDASKSEGASSYKWYLGDGSVKEGIETNHIYQFPGTYLVTLEVGNGQESALDQLKAIVFGGKAVISEFFMPAASSSPQWLEIFNPHGDSVDLAGWILEAGKSSFVFPPFVVVTPKGFLVLSQETTGLNFYQNNSIKFKYPNGTVVDEVIFEKTIPGFSASRTASGFFWSKEPTPGRANIVLNSTLSENAAVTPKKIAVKSESSQPANYLASFYSVVEEPPNQSSNTLAGSGEIFQQTGFWQKLADELLFWVMLAVLVGLIMGLFYVRLSKRTNADHIKSH